MKTQPEPRVLVELTRTLGRVFGNLRFEQTLVARGLGRRGRGVNDGLDDAARAEDGSGPQSQNVRGGATLCFIFRGDVAAADLKLADVMFEYGRRDGDDAREVARRCARARLDIREV